MGSNNTESTPTQTTTQYNSTTPEVVQVETVFKFLLLAENESEQFTRWDEVPSELTGLLIFSYLEGKDLCRASQVSREWNRMANNEFLWENLCKACFPTEMAWIDASFVKQNKSWRWFFECRSAVITDKNKTTVSRGFVSLDSPKMGLYFGEWRDGKKSGYGYWVTEPGTLAEVRYEGQLEDDNKVEGIYHYSNGNSFRGAEGNKTRGTFIWAKSHNRYEGEMVNGMLHGEGTLFYASGNKYTGQWECNQRSGKGTLEWSNGTKYEGEWKNDQRNGWGITTSRDGYIHEGMWVDDRMCGYGKRITNNGANVYEGDYLDDKRHGYGTYMWGSPNNRIHYMGEWRNDKIHGRGVQYFLKSKIRYEGEFYENQMHGEGTMTFPNGDMFIGRWYYSKQTGWGKMVYKSKGGLVKEGHWENFQFCA